MIVVFSSLCWVSKKTQISQFQISRVGLSIMCQMDIVHLRCTKKSNNHITVSTNIRLSFKRYFTILTLHQSPLMFSDAFSNRHDALEQCVYSWNRLVEKSFSFFFSIASMSCTWLNECASFTHNNNCAASSGVFLQAKLERRRASKIFIRFNVFDKHSQFTMLLPAEVFTDYR